MNKNRKKQLLKQWRTRERTEARAGFAVPVNELELMFDGLDAELPRQGSGHTRRLTRAWLEGRGNDVGGVFTWPDDHGGFCDCEALANAEQRFQEAMRES